MPSLPPSKPTRLQPDSWPPSPGRQTPSLEDDSNSTDDDELDAEENPILYFLTPPTPKEEELEFAFDFDVDDPNHQEISRSVSPSTLDGLRRYKSKSKVEDCAILDDDDDDDDEDYIRFPPRQTLPFGFEDFFDKPKHASTSRTTEALLSPASFHVGSPRGRPSKPFAPPRHPFRGRSRSLSLQRKHSWREPSPDVYSIEEEPEKETMSEMGLSVESLDTGLGRKTQPIDIPAAKPKKRVRFLLPVKD
ncbi:hypothetical protein F5B20DRAFT_171898 [Whalleya microplaca]|nr:hypothetical protein F5B20DRAFT_171898 [Whalleya microplaca]